MIDKKSARVKARNYRDLLSDEDVAEYSERIADNVVALKEFIEAGTIYIYASINNEVDTRYIVDAAMRMNKTVAFPRVTDETLRFYRVDNPAELEFGYFGIQEPVENSDKLVDTDCGMVIMPGVAFDRQFHRVGYGRGFYDRFLYEHEKLVKVAIAYEGQFFDELETGEYDIAPDMIITEKNIYRRNNI